MKSLGICLGASTISIVELIKTGRSIKIEKTINKAHEGNPRDILVKELKKLDLGTSIAVTGRKFRDLVNLSSISEPEAVEVALTYLRDNHMYDVFDAVVSLGGENFMTYVLDNNAKISTVITGNKCASGTGEFFLQQIRRMDISVNDAVNLAKKGKPYNVAGRCSVFCKSDCTHALNKGEPKENVVAGLCKMMANKVLELLDKVKNCQKVLLIGGASQNEVMVNLLKEDIPTLLIPKEAPYFEALGTALWALSHDTKKFPGFDKLMKSEFSSFRFLPSLKDFESEVVFKTMKKSEAKEGDICILGLDVGSTTTKAVIMRKEDNAILASIYLRTNGNPVLASRECYKELFRQVYKKVKIIGLGVTGSGRQISGLHALTDGIINEIIAHATAAVYFDKDVDTIFEIGGQDAKYTYITNGIASDYAMNEACSAGTGSFLEESAKETLGIEMTDIADLALKGKDPPNFNDQCAAFISSDIKNAMHEGVEKKDIIAGLVYSICMNYTNRVKGNRPIGKRIFMQGGVCYNKAVPIAMASLTGKNIIVPPHPGLMGAFGVALEIKKRQESKLLKEEYYNLNELAEREIEYGKPFVCAGGGENCDLKCKITTIKIKDKLYPFGGACNKYANIRQNLNYDVKKLDLAILRQKLIFEKYTNQTFFNEKQFNKKQSQKTIGINQSLYVETLYPLYYNFFTKLGLGVIVPDTIESEGINKKGAAFCYPIEISHGYMQNLIKKNPDYFFLPHLESMYVQNGIKSNCTCPFVQGESYFLRTAFKELNQKEIISPVIDFDNGYHGAKGQFIRIGNRLGINKEKSSEAFDFALQKQTSFQREIKEIGRNMLNELEKDPSKIGIVIFGRPYNAFSKKANMGIPHKFASRGILTIPFDFLPYEDEEPYDYMYWSVGQMMLKAAKFVKKHPRLFATYITNFSCGPDSFIITYFRSIMGKKPSLILELDSHTSDVGVNTRIEAALDIIKGYHELEQHKKIPMEEEQVTPATIIREKEKYYVITTNGEKLGLKDSRVRILIPSMGDISSRLAAAALRSHGFRAQALKIPDMEVLNYGRSNSSCKECLPLILTTGGLIYSIKNEKKEDEVIVYYMPRNESGPCRFGQYHFFMNHLIKKNNIKDVAIFSPSSGEGYAGLPLLRALKAIVAGDVLDDIKNALKVLPKDRINALKIFEKELNLIISSFEDKTKNPLKQLKRSIKVLNAIPLRYPLSEAKIIALVGEIYVRRDSFSRQNIENKLAEKDFIVKIAPVLEWIQYLPYTLKIYLTNPNLSLYKKLTYSNISLYKKISLCLKIPALNFIEKQIKNLFRDCKLCNPELVDINSIVGHSKHIISPHLKGEAVLTIGSALKEVLDSACGVISVGPFGCMPSRIAEAILSEEMTLEGKIKASRNNFRIDGLSHLPFLAIETDGNPFPQIIQSKLETFCLQANRVHEKMMKRRKDNHCITYPFQQQQ